MIDTAVLLPGNALACANIKLSWTLKRPIVFCVTIIHHRALESRVYPSSGFDKRFPCYIRKRHPR